MKRRIIVLTALAVAGWLAASAGTTDVLAKDGDRAPGLWPLAQSMKAVHRFSTLFTAQDVRDRLSAEEGLDGAIAWCRATGVTKVYLEEYRDGYRADGAAIRHARERFLAAGCDVSGCVTTTRIGKSSTQWKNTISCYTDAGTQEQLQSIFEFAAGLFDELMIDDFWFTNCDCPECDAARRAKAVTVGARTFTVRGDTWEDYRCELMTRVSQERVLAAARRVNPKVKLIIKYPQWYDEFHERGYEVMRETADFDRIWVGTETRDYTDKSWGGTVQYEGCFLMRWLGGIGGAKCGGGWFDWLGTTEKTYVEQARQTVLGGARESMLFCYGGLQNGTGPKDVEALRAELPALFEAAAQVRRSAVAGVAAYKPPNSHPESEPRVFDFVGMLGLPLAPCHEFPADAPAAFFSLHAAKDPDLAAKLSKFIAAGKPVLLTDGLARRLEGMLETRGGHVHILPVKGDPKSLLQLPQAELDALRATLLGPLKLSLRAPARVALYAFSDGSAVVENFNDAPVTVELNGKSLAVAPRDWVRTPCAASPGQ